MDIKTRIEQRTAKLDEMRSVLIAEKRDPNKSEMQKADGILAEIRELELKPATENILKPDPQADHTNRSTKKMDYENINENEIRVMGADRSYRAMFYPGKADAEKLDDGGFRDAGEFLDVLVSGRFDPRLQQRAAMVQGTPSLGGFSVPTQFVSDWMDDSLAAEVTRPRCRVYPMKSESIKIPGWNASDFSSGSYAGLKMEFLGESAVGSKQTGKLRQITLNANEGAIYVDASLSLVANGVNFESQLRSAMIAAIGYGIDRHTIGSAGSGAGCPLSVLNSACLISISGETGQASGSVVFSNIKKLYARQLNPQSAVWLVNATTIPSLLELSITGGTSASHVPVLNESNGEFTMLGRPCIITPHAPAIGSASCITFVDFSFYALGLRSEVVLDMTDSHRWTQRERSFRARISIDGQISLNTAITPENGDTLSPVTSLAAI